MRPARWAIFLSGRGSNAQAFWELISEIDIAVCVSSKSQCAGVLKAKRLGIPTIIIKNPIDWLALTKNLKAQGINRIFLLGFMKILPAEFCEAWVGKMWNLHPSLLPDFAGAEAIERSYEAGGRFGVSVHEVTAEMDAGPLCLQKKRSEQVKTEFVSIGEAQMRISQTEQRLVREWAGRVQARTLSRLQEDAAWI